MHTTSTRIARVGAAALGAVALAVLGFAGPASAAQNAGTIDASKDGQAVLHVVKAADAQSATAGDGTQRSVTTPVAGAGFTIYPVQYTGTGTYQASAPAAHSLVSLTTNAGWADATAAISGIHPTAGSIASTIALNAGYELGSAVTAEQTTDATGDATFGSLHLGVYLVVETHAPAGSAGAVAPYFVTVPLTDPTSHAWLYTVYTYPKNVITSPTKTVSDASAKVLGDTITYTITVPLSHQNGNVYSSLTIDDALNGSLALTGTTPVSLAVTGAATQPVQGTDYTVSGASVAFTAGHLGSLNDANATAIVETFTAKATAVGSIPNTATVTVNGSTPVTTAAVLTKWGSITIQKTDGTNGLNGAVFAIYATKADAEADRNRLTVGGTQTFTTANDGTTDGVVTISGLRYTGFANGAIATDTPYYLAEITAPTGYELLAEPVAVSIDDATSAAGIDKTIVDVPTNAGFVLPLTGGTGTAIVYISGGVVLGLGIALIIVLARRRRAADDQH